MTGSRKPRQQYGALPWRRRSELEILLVTSRRTQRWVIPKGWPIAGLAPHEAAAQEAFEEAGVSRGAVDASAIGHFTYVKLRKDGTKRTCRVDVFALEVDSEADEWPEKDKRVRRWFSPAEAAQIVHEADLQELIRKFSKS